MESAFVATPGPTEHLIVSGLFESGTEFLLGDLGVNLHHLLSNVDDGLAHVHACLRAHFMELHSFLLEQLKVLFLYLLFRFVALVGENVCLGILRVDLALFEPEVHDVLEGFGVVDIVD